MFQVGQLTGVKSEKRTSEMYLIIDENIEPELTEDLTEEDILTFKEGFCEIIDITALKQMSFDNENGIVCWIDIDRREDD